MTSKPESMPGLGRDMTKNYIAFVQINSWPHRCVVSGPKEKDSPRVCIRLLSVSNRYNWSTTTTSSTLIIQKLRRVQTAWWSCQYSWRYVLLICKSSKRWTRMLNMFNVGYFWSPCFHRTHLNRIIAHVFSAWLEEKKTLTGNSGMSIILLWNKWFRQLKVSLCACVEGKKSLYATGTISHAIIQLQLNKLFAIFLSVQEHGVMK